MKDSVINKLAPTKDQVATVAWSANSSPGSMAISDPTKIFLGCGTTDRSLGVIRLADLTSGRAIEVVENVQNSAVRAIAWCPQKQGLLATGGGEGDQIIRLWDFVGKQPDYFVHSLKCSSPITSLGWRKSPLVA